MRSHPRTALAGLLLSLLLHAPCCRAGDEAAPLLLPSTADTDPDGSCPSHLPVGPAWTDPACARPAGDEWLRPPGPGLGDVLCYDGGVLGRDFAHAWSCGHMADLGVALGVAGVFANTTVDQRFRDWYQRDVRSSFTDALADVGKVFGEHWFVVPACVGALAVGNCYDETRWGPAARDWGGRSIRAYCVGGPAVLALQYGLGASRPDDPRGYGSSWHPFRDNNGVAGHGFAGAVPFLAAASVCENRWLRRGLVLGSFWTTFSRINSDSHYLSQAVLGWTIAAVSVDSVVQTDRERVSLSTIALPDGGRGVGFLIKF